MELAPSKAHIHLAIFLKQMEMGLKREKQ